MDFLLDYLIAFDAWVYYAAVVGVLLLCGLGLPIPEDITLFAAGMFAYYGVISLYPTIALCLFGVIFGDSVIFGLGYHYGRKLTRSSKFFHKILPDERLDEVQKKFASRGDKLLFAARFMPGLRAPIFFSAGTLRVPYKMFLLYDGGAALISVPAIVGAVYYFGDAMEQVIGVIKKIEHGIVFVIFTAILVIAGKWWLTHRKAKHT